MRSQETQSQRKNPYKQPAPYNNYVAEAQERRKENEEAFMLAMLLSRDGKWDKVIDIGLHHPAIMDRLCNSLYNDFPDEIKYSLPVRWFFDGGNSSEAVNVAVERALQYRPEKWIGREKIENKPGIDIFICSKAPLSDVPRLMLWTDKYNAAYLDSQRYGGKVLRGYLPSDKIIAIADERSYNILQFKSVLGIEIVYPQIRSSRLAL